MSLEGRAFRAVIFDLDGVLVDAEIWWDEVRIDFAGRHGRTWTEEDRAAIMGANSFGWSTLMRDRLALSDVPREVIEAEIVDAMVTRYRSDGAPLIPGAVATVRRVAAELPVAVASSGHPRVIAAALDALGIADAFAVVVSSDAVPLGKPAPDVYLLAAAQLDVPPVDLPGGRGLAERRPCRSCGGDDGRPRPERCGPPGRGSSGGRFDRARPDRRPRHRVAGACRRSAQMSPTDRPTGSAATGPAEATPPERPGRPTALERPGRPASVDRPIAAWRRTIRYAVAMTFSWLAVRAVFRVRVEGRDRLPVGPALLCFNHQSWSDPFVLMATLPWRPRLYFFGPKEEDMATGGRNRIMKWTGTAIPFRPGKNDLIEATRRVGAILDGGGVVAIAGEGRIHAGEGELLPLNEGAAFFALRSGVPLVPVAVNGTSWLTFGRRVRVRIGEPIPVDGRPTREAVAELSATTWTALHGLLADYPDPTPPPAGSAWYRFTEMFNEWPDGGRPRLPAIRGATDPRRPTGREGPSTPTDPAGEGPSAR